jgi:glutathione S-transferase
VIMEHECYGAPAFSAVTRPILYSKLDEQRDSVNAALPTFREELGRLETQLEGRSWFVGDAVSAADIFVFPTIKTIERLLRKPAGETIDHGVLPLSGPFPKLAAWVARIEALPGYDVTYPPHWREG